jgi:hypothetical protein
VFHVIRESQVSETKGVKRYRASRWRFSTSIGRFNFLLADLPRQREYVNPACVALALANIAMEA